jgi:integrase/recombinase XerD
MRLADVRTADVAAFAAWRANLNPRRTIGPASVNRDLAQFKALCSWLVQTERLATSPAERVKQAKEFKGTEPIRIIEPARFQAIVDQLAPHWARAIEALLVTGMRWGSLVKLRPEHLDTGRRVVRLVKPKGKQDVELQITSARGWEALVWCAADGKFAPDVGSCNKALRVAAEKAGVPKITAHMLRHTFAVRALEAGASVRDLQRWLGHAQITTTERYLRHAKPKPPPELL